MRKVARTAMLPLAFVLVMVAGPSANAAPALPNSMAAVGDSITRAHDACCWYGDHASDSWSTGASSFDGVSSQYERLRALNPTIAGHQHNDAVTGAKASDLSNQVAEAVSQPADYVTVLIGANDQGTSSANTMTSTGTFRREEHAALATLHAQLPATRTYVSSIPNLYQLWATLHTNSWARVHVVRGRDLSVDAGVDERRDPTATGGAARAGFQPDPLAGVRAVRAVPMGRQHRVQLRAFSAGQVSSLDYFHPSLGGQAARARITWAASWWG